MIFITAEPICQASATSDDRERIHTSVKRLVYLFFVVLSGAQAQSLPPGCDLPAQLRQMLAAAPTAELYNSAAAELAKEHKSACAIAALQEAIALKPRYAEAQ